MRVAQNYEGDFILIRNTSGNNVDAFVSKYGGSGDDSWFPVGDSFAGSAAKWSRSSWEVVVFRDRANNNKRVGRYINAHGKTTQITFRSFENIEIVTSD